MSYIIGINELLHDTAAALIKDGQLIGAIEEERLTGERHAAGFCLQHGCEPKNSIQWCLDYFGLKDSDLDGIAFGFHVPGLRSLGMLAEVTLDCLKKMPPSAIIKESFFNKDPGFGLVHGATVGFHINHRRFVEKMKQRFGKVAFIPHHLAHAASAFRVSGFEQANIIVIDGLGDETPTSVWAGEGNQIRPLKKFSPHQSLGALYRRITQLCGFVYFDAGKTMGLAAYGKQDLRFTDMVEISDSDYHLNLWHLRKMCKYARNGNEEISEDHKNIAATMQRLLEKAGLMLAHWAYQQTGYRKVCLAGGVALNCVMNSLILQSDFVDDIYVQPGAMDMGAAIGAALEMYAQCGYQSRSTMEHAYWGPEYSKEQIVKELPNHPVSWTYHEDIEQQAAKLLSEHKIIGWFQGRLEFGPRALGNRSILANPAKIETKDQVNVIKQRELWRPLAPAILREAMSNWFEDPYDSPFMTLNFYFKKEKAPLVPAVVHTDGSARVQSVTKDTNPRFWKLLKEFEKLTGLPMLLNTSFNRRKQPIICDPETALKTFLVSGLDALVIGNYLVYKNDRKNS